MKIKDKKTHDSYIKVKRARVLGPKYIGIYMFGTYAEEDKPRQMNQFITKDQAKKLLNRLIKFVNSTE